MGNLLSARVAHYRMIDYPLTWVESSSGSTGSATAQEFLVAK